ncbi:hypothetical protein D3C80_1468750 [compost metagenome]
MIKLPKSRMLQIEVIQRSGVGLHLLVTIIFKQKPIQLLLILPLNKLTEFPPHKHQLLARKGDLIPEQQSKTCKFLLVRSRHFIKKRFFSMNHLIM